MDMSTSLRTLGVPPGGLRAYQRHLLDTDGILILPRILDMPTVEKMRQRLAELHALEGDSAGTEVNREPGADRLSNLVNKDAIFDVCFTHPTVLAAASHVLTDFKLSSVCSRDPLPGTGAQALHADWTHEQPLPGDFQVCNSIWLLDDFTADNGATRFVPGSHRSNTSPATASPCPEARHPYEQLLTGPAGTVAVFNGHLWHGGTLNATNGLAPLANGLLHPPAQSPAGRPEGIRHTSYPCPPGKRSKVHPRHMNTARPIPTITLNNGVVMPHLGLGTWPMDDNEVQTVAAQAIALGYRMFDTAEVYGNEAGLGRTLRQTDVPRDELFVISKLRGRHHAYDKAIGAFHESLSRLRLDYLDLYLIHWPVPDQDLYVDAWRALEKLRADGYVRAIGVSNFAPSHIDRIAAETYTLPAVNQVQLHPGIARPDWRTHTQARGIILQAWSPLGQARKLIDHEAIHAIAHRLGRTPAQIILRWHIELGLCPIVRSARPERLKKNSEIFDFALSPEDLAVLSTLDRTDLVGADPERLQPM